LIRAHNRRLAAAYLMLAIALGGCPDPDPTDSPSIGTGDQRTTGGDAAFTRDTYFTRLEIDLPSLECGRDEVPTILESLGGGAAIVDADSDGDMDLFLVEPGPYPSPGGPSGKNRLYRNDGGTFTDVSDESGVAVGGFGNGVAVADIDSDGDRDLYVARLGANALLRNDSTESDAPTTIRFTEVPDASGAAGDDWSISPLFFDADNDGDMDLYVVNYVVFDPANPPMHGDDHNCIWNERSVYCGPQGLIPAPDRFYRNENGQFLDSTEPAGFQVQPGFGLGAIDGDFNQDGVTDLYVTNDSTPNFLFLQEEDGRFTEQGVLSGAGLSAHGREQAGMGVASGDLDGDLDEDLFVTNFSMDDNALYIHDEGGFFTDRSGIAQLGASSRMLLGWGAAFVDVELDGDLDVIAANGHVYPQADGKGTGTTYAMPDRLWLNDGAARFSLASWPGDEPEVSRTLATGDLDGDRITDLLILPRAGRPWVWRGEADPKRALQIQITGPPGNPDGCGATLSFTDSHGTQLRRIRNSGGYQAVCDPRPVFAWRGAGELKVRFPDQTEQTMPVSEAGIVRLEFGS